MTPPAKSGNGCQVLPAPTIVVGLGRMGLDVLERLGEDWFTLRQSGADDSLRNLRLLHVASDAATDEAWRRREEKRYSTVRAARFLGESDLPSLALDFVLLRSLGLIRYRDGAYQIALPTDAGVVELGKEAAATKTPSGETDSVPPAQESTDPDKKDEEKDLVRRRFFSWLNLSPDPIIAAERLYRLAERSSDLDLFVTPLLNRIRQGHSPDVLLHCIARCQILDEGRDPSPWRWIADLTGGLPKGQSAEIRIQRRDDAKRRLALTAYDYYDKNRLGKPPLEDFAEAPLPNWKEWWRFRGTRSRGELGIRIPRIFHPDKDDLVLELDLPALLEIDWETTGWATGDEAGKLRFQIVQASPFRLGLFDHDEGDLAGTELQVKLEERLRELAGLTYQGLMRLWIDLRQERVEETSAALLNLRRRENVDEALLQSLEILREMVIHRIAPKDDTDPPSATSASPSETETSRTSGPKSTGRGGSGPSLFLRHLIVQRPRLGNVVEQQLTDRLVDLGLESADEADKLASYLCSSVEVSPEQVDKADARAADGLALIEHDPERPPDGDQELLRVRRVLNHMVGELFGLSFLTRYRNQPIRRPPRLTIFLVGDMAEPFVRSTCRTVLREIHAELLRSFTPIFEYFREGFDRALSIVPIIWMPHPADPFEGDGGVERQREEAAIVNAIQSTRRWVESVIPIARRRVSQIFINSRVTDTSVLSHKDAVRQTRDFIAFQTRNAIHADEWLRRTAVGPFGDDFFSSFSCYEIEFPAEKACEYLSNRLAQDLLHRALEGRVHRGIETEIAGFGPPPEEKKEALPKARRALAEITRAAAGRVAGRVTGRAAVEPCSKSRDLCERFDERFELQLEREIQLAWEGLARSHGEMDRMIDGVRQETSQTLATTLEQARQWSDENVQELAGEYGIRAAVSRLHDLRDIHREVLVRCEEGRRDHERLCLLHGIPSPARVRNARKEVVTAAELKPECRPMVVHALLWLVLAPVLGGPLCQGLAYALDLHLRPTWLEPVLGTYGLWTGGLLAAAAATLLLVSKLRAGAHRVRTAIRHLAATARSLIHGADEQPETLSPSIHSFFATRLLLTDVLASRSFALQVFESSETDFRLADRMGRSVDTQCQVLRRRAEDLGARPAMSGDRRKEDLGHLFTTRSGEKVESLIQPRVLTDYYDQRFGPANEVFALLPLFLSHAGGFYGWRTTAVLAKTEKVLGYTRQQFKDLLERTLASLPQFADEAAGELVQFVAQRYANIGFGAKFVGSEGLDPDGVNLVAEAALVLCSDLKRLFEKGRRQPDVPPTTQTMEVLERAVRGNAAYMLSLAQGIRPHTIRNLKRFESFHDRTFALMGYEQPGSVNHFTAYPELSRSLWPRDRTQPGRRRDDEGSEE